MNIFSITDSLKSLLAKNLPGKNAQDRMMTKPRVLADPPYSEDQATQASVLILLFPDKSDIRFFLTKRTKDVAHHKGQISLPGGVQEDGETLDQTALRETHEEIGVNGENVSVIGRLTPLFIPFTGFNVHPFIGWMDFIPAVTPEKSEVHHLFSVSIFDMLKDENIFEETVTYKGQSIRLPYFQLEDQKIWGATAMILSEFKTILRKFI